MCAFVGDGEWLVVLDTTRFYQHGCPAGGLKCVCACVLAAGELAVVCAFLLWAQHMGSHPEGLDQILDQMASKGTNLDFAKIQTKNEGQ